MSPGNLEIARNAALKPIEDIANEMGLGSHLLEPYGRDVMKVSLDAIEELADRPRAKYVVVTAITPTPLGEGKTTTTVGIGQGMRHIDKKASSRWGRPGRRVLGVHACDVVMNRLGDVVELTPRRAAASGILMSNASMCFPLRWCRAARAGPVTDKHRKWTSPDAPGPGF